MRRAIVNRRMVSAADYALFSAADRARAGPPTCPECRVEVHPYGLRSPGVTPRYDHPDAPPGVSLLDDCSLARRSDRLRWFGADEIDEERGRNVRREFLSSDERLAKGYAFCLGCAGRGTLPLAKFKLLLAAADRLRIWSYVGLELWCIPHVLLLLADFETGQPQAFHFSLLRTGRLSAIWDGRGPVRLVKLFSDSGKPFSRMPLHENPLPIRERETRDAAISWMGSGMIRTLKSFGRLPDQAVREAVFEQRGGIE